MSSQYHEENGFRHDLDLLIILHKLCVTYPTRSGCGARNILLKTLWFLKVGVPNSVTLSDTYI